MSSARGLWTFLRPGPLVVTGVLVVGVVTSPWWRPYLDRLTSVAVDRPGDSPAVADGHEGHDHGEIEHETIHLSPQARRNLGLTEEFVRPLSLQDWRATISVPAMVIEQPGCAHWSVSAPMTGIVTRVHAVPGESVAPGAVLFEMRLTHEDLVRTQVEFLRTLGELDVELRELERLREPSQSGAIAGKAFLERQYAYDRLQALIQAQRESLRLHGLSEAQVDRIARERTLLQDLQIVAPSPDPHAERSELRLSRTSYRMTDNAVATAAPQQTDGDHEALLAVKDLAVHTGETVEAGHELCVLVGLDHLYVEGQAFEQDAAAVMRALDLEWTVEAIPDAAAGRSTVIPDLRIAWVSNQIDPDSRSLRFYLPLTNTVVRDTTDASGRRYVQWRFRPGQRMTLKVPVEELTNQLVIPAEAVATDGPEAFVYLQNGDHFDEIPVQILHRDGQSAVLAADGSVFPGDVIAMHSAHQLRMAIRNQSGTGGGDAHHGHMH